MKHFGKLALALSVLTASSFATSLHPDTFRAEAAPVLGTLQISNVGKTGRVLKSDRLHPYTKFLIGLPVDVDTQSVCTQFVGQQKLERRSSVVGLRAVGATDPMVDACIQIAVEPVKTHLTLEMNVVTGGFVPADDIQTQIVEIETVGRFEVVLDINNETVKIRPLR